MPLLDMPEQPKLLFQFSSTIKDLAILVRSYQWTQNKVKHVLLLGYEPFQEFKKNDGFGPNPFIDDMIVSSTNEANSKCVFTSGAADAINDEIFLK